MKIRNKIKNLILLFIATLLCLTTAYAEDTTPTYLDITGTKYINDTYLTKNGVVIVPNQDADSTTILNYKGINWFVIGTDGTSKVTLLSVDNIGYSIFSNGTERTYAGSVIESYIKTYFGVGADDTNPYMLLDYSSNTLNSSIKGYAKYWYSAGISDESNKIWAYATGWHEYTKDTSLGVRPVVTIDLTNIDLTTGKYTDPSTSVTGTDVIVKVINHSTLGDKKAVSINKLPLTIDGVTITPNQTATTINYAGKKWYAIGTNGSDKVTLILKNYETAKMFDSTSNEYYESDIREYLNGTFLTELENGGAITTDLKSIMLNDVLTYNSSTSTAEVDGIVQSDKVFLLSYKEAFALNSDIRNSGSNWWLRSTDSLNERTMYADAVDTDNSIIDKKLIDTNSTIMVRPVIVLNLSNLTLEEDGSEITITNKEDEIFVNITSLSKNGKIITPNQSDLSETTVVTYGGNDWFVIGTDGTSKVTLLSVDNISYGEYSSGSTDYKGSTLKTNLESYNLSNGRELLGITFEDISDTERFNIYTLSKDEILTSYSMEEDQIVYNNDGTGTKVIPDSILSYARYWWTRTEKNGNIYGVVGGDIGEYSTSTALGYRPVVTLDLKNIDISSSTIFKIQAKGYLTTRTNVFVNTTEVTKDGITITPNQPDVTVEDTTTNATTIVSYAGKDWYVVGTNGKGRMTLLAKDTYNVSGTYADISTNLSNVFNSLTEQQQDSICSNGVYTLNYKELVKISKSLRAFESGDWWLETSTEAIANNSDYVKSSDKSLWYQLSTNTLAIRPAVTINLYDVGFELDEETGKVILTKAQRIFVNQTRSDVYGVTLMPNQSKAEDTTILNFAGKNWYVIGTDGTYRATIMATDNIGYSTFSDVETTLENLYNNMTQAQKDIVLSRTDLENAKIYLLSEEEIASAQKDVLGTAKYWWTRTNGEEGYQKVFESESVVSEDNTKIQGIRPVLTINLEENDFTNTSSVVKVVNHSTLGDNKAVYVNINPITRGSVTITPNKGTEETISFGGKEWYAIGSDGSEEIALISKEAFGTTTFDDTDNLYYSSSDLSTDSIVNQYLRNTAISSLSGNTSVCLEETTLNQVQTSQGNLDSIARSEQMFLLSYEEARNLNSDIKNINKNWWLRSSNIGTTDTADIVTTSGNIKDTDVTDSGIYVRPAIILNLWNMNVSKSGQVITIEPIEITKDNIADYINQTTITKNNTTITPNSGKNTTIVNYGGKDWFVIGTDGENRLTLLALDNAGYSEYGNSTYSRSTAKATLKTTTANANTSITINTMLEDSPEAKHSTFLLNQSEANLVDSYIKGYTRYWFTRTTENNIAKVYKFNDFENSDLTTSQGIRPAIIVDISKINNITTSSIIKIVNTQTTLESRKNVYVNTAHLEKTTEEGEAVNIYTNEYEEKGTTIVSFKGKEWYAIGTDGANKVTLMAKDTFEPAGTYSSVDTVLTSFINGLSETDKEALVEISTNQKIKLVSYNEAYDIASTLRESVNNYWLINKEGPRNEYISDGVISNIGTDETKNIIPVIIVDFSKVDISLADSKVVISTGDKAYITSKYLEIDGVVIKPNQERLEDTTLVSYAGKEWYVIGTNNSNRLTLLSTDNIEYMKYSSTSTAVSYENSNLRQELLDMYKADYTNGLIGDIALKRGNLVCEERYEDEEQLVENENYQYDGYYYILSNEELASVSDSILSSAKYWFVRPGILNESASTIGVYEGTRIVQENNTSSKNAYGLRLAVNVDLETINLTNTNIIKIINRSTKGDGLSVNVNQSPITKNNVTIRPNQDSDNQIIDYAGKEWYAIGTNGTNKITLLAKDSWETMQSKVADEETITNNYYESNITKYLTTSAIDVLYGTNTLEDKTDLKNVLLNEVLTTSGSTEPLAQGVTDEKVQTQIIFLLSYSEASRVKDSIKMLKDSDDNILTWYLRSANPVTSARMDVVSKDGNNNLIISNTSGTTTANIRPAVVLDITSMKASIDENTGHIKLESQTEIFINSDYVTIDGVVIKPNQERREDTTIVSYAGHDWYVIGVDPEENSEKVTLLSVDNWKYDKFMDSGESTDYNESQLKEYLDSEYDTIGSGQSLIIKVKFEDVNSKQGFYLISQDEGKQVSKDILGIARYWWTRTKNTSVGGSDTEAVKESNLNTIINSVVEKITKPTKTISEEQTEENGYNDGLEYAKELGKEVGKEVGYNLGYNAGYSVGENAGDADKTGNNYEQSGTSISNVNYDNTTTVPTNYTSTTVENVETKVPTGVLNFLNDQVKGNPVQKTDEEGNLLYDSDTGNPIYETDENNEIVYEMVAKYTDEYIQGYIEGFNAIAKTTTTETVIDENGETAEVTVETETESYYILAYKDVYGSSYIGGYSEAFDAGYEYGYGSSNTLWAYYGKTWKYVNTGVELGIRPAVTIDLSKVDLTSTTSPVKVINYSTLGNDKAVYVNSNPISRDGVTITPNKGTDTVIEFAGYEWYAIGSDGSNEIALIAKDNVWGSATFDNESNLYYESTIREKMFDMLSTEETKSIFSLKRQAIMEETTLNHVRTAEGEDDGMVQSDKIFLLSYKEAFDLNDDIRDFAGSWYLRDGSGTSTKNADMVNGNIMGNKGVTNLLSLRPAIVLSLENTEVTKVGNTVTIEVIIDMATPIITTSSATWTNDKYVYVYISPGQYVGEYLETEKIYYDVFGKVWSKNNWTEYKSKVLKNGLAISTEGITTVRARSISEEGIASPEARATVYIDKTGPNAEFELTTENVALTDHTIKVTVEDKLSGFVRGYYAWSESSTTKPKIANFTPFIGSPIVINTPSNLTKGTYYLWLILEDNAGNQSVVCSNVSCSIDPDAVSDTTETIGVYTVLINQAFEVLVPGDFGGTDITYYYKDTPENTSNSGLTATTVTNIENGKISQYTKLNGILTTVGEAIVRVKIGNVYKYVILNVVDVPQDNPVVIQ